MKPAPFEYFVPASIDEALRLLGTHGARAKLLAGGQSFVPMANFRVLRPDVVIDLNRIPALAYIRETSSALAIGAMTRHRAIERSELVRRRCPLMAKAVRFIGHAAIRNRGTLGGSLSHADPAAEWPVVAVALRATMIVRGPKGERRIPAAQFFVALLSTALAPDEILAEVEFPVCEEGTGTAFVEVSRRHGDFALVSVAAQIVRSASGRVRAARITLGGVGPTPHDADECARGLVGQVPSERDLDAVGERVAKGLQPNQDLHASSQYRRDVAAVLVGRALKAAVEDAKGRR